MLEQTLKDNIQKINQTIETATKLSHREKDSVHLVCVSKSVDVETTQQVVDTGIYHLAENRVEKLLEKKSKIKTSEPITWHFIGNLQRRKVKEIINEIDYFHALDSVKLASEINKRATQEIKCFLQVNVSGEVSKQGISPEEIDSVIQAIADLERVKIVGLMTMAPINSQETELRNIFSQLSNLRDQIAEQKLPHAPCLELSMGMSQDYGLAIEEGATFVRVGSEFFNQKEKEVEER